MKIIDSAENFEDCARSWAEHLDQPFNTYGREFEMDLALLQTLFCGIYPETIEYIEIDPPAFAARVAAYRHGMER